MTKAMINTFYFTEKVSGTKVKPLTSQECVYVWVSESFAYSFTQIVISIDKIILKNPSSHYFFLSRNLFTPGISPLHMRPSSTIFVSGIQKLSLTSSITWSFSSVPPFTHSHIFDQSAAKTLVPGIR